MINRWWRVLGAVLMNLALGSLAAWSVFVAPLERELGWTRAQTSPVFPIAVVAFAASLIVAGVLQDRRGPFRIALTGAILLGSGFVLAAAIHALWMLYLTLGVLAGLGNGFAGVTPVVVLAKSFPTRRGLVIGLAVAAYGGSSALAALLVPPLQSLAGWRGAFLVLGVAYFAAALAGAYLLVNPPVVAAAARECTPGEMVRTKQFPWMWSAFLLSNAGALLTLTQLAPLTRSSGAMALLLAAIAAGRLGCGALSDVIGRLPMLRVAMLISAAAIVAVPRVSTLALLYVLVFAIHFAHGALLAVIPAATADFFGTKRLGTNHAIVSLASTAAAVVAPLAGAAMVRMHHGNHYVFSVAGLISVAALILMLKARRPDEAPAPAAVLVPKGATP